LPLEKVAKRMIVVPYRDNDGNVNTVDCTDTFNEAYFTALVNQEDSSKKWFPYPDMLAVEDVRADSVFETIDDEEFFVEKGVRTFNAMLPNQAPAFLGQIETVRCTEIGAYFVDIDGNLIGNGKVDGELRPIKINNRTWDPKLMKPKRAEIQKIGLKFQFDSTERDEDIRMISSTTLVYDLLDLEGVRDVCFENIAAATGVGTSNVSFNLIEIYGYQCSKIIVKGLDTADYSVEVDGVPETPASVTEAPDGTYVLATSDLSGGEELEVKIVKDGLEALKGNTVTA